MSRCSDGASTGFVVADEDDEDGTSVDFEVLACEAPAAGINGHECDFGDPSAGVFVEDVRGEAEFELGDFFNIGHGTGGNGGAEVVA